MYFVRSSGSDFAGSPLAGSSGSVLRPGEINFTSLFLLFLPDVGAALNRDYSDNSEFSVTLEPPNKGPSNDHEGHQGDFRRAIRHWRLWSGWSSWSICEKGLRRRKKTSPVFGTQIRQFPCATTPTPIVTSCGPYHHDCHKEK